MSASGSSKFRFFLAALFPLLAVGAILFYKPLQAPPLPAPVDTAKFTPTSKPYIPAKSEKANLAAAIASLRHSAPANMPVPRFVLSMKCLQDSAAKKKIMPSPSAPTAMTPLKLNMVFFTAGKHQAMINGRLYQTGMALPDGRRVIAINPDNVVVGDSQRRITMPWAASWPAS